MGSGRRVTAPWLAVLPVLVAVAASDCHGATATDATVKLKYGFRYDPMKWIENDRSLEGAKVRTFVLKKPTPGDKEKIAKKINELLAEARQGGAPGAGKLLRLAELGVDAKLPEVKRSIDWMVNDTGADYDTRGARALHVLCRLGAHQATERDARLRKVAARLKKRASWKPVVDLRALWAGRKFVDVSDALDAGLTWLAEGLNEAGCLGGNHPWTILTLAGEVRNPRGRRIVEKMIPFILRSQNPDGGFGGVGGEWWPPSEGQQSFVVLQALVRHNLLDKLRELPPLPADWKVVRSIPAPEGQVWALAWDGARFWAGQKNTREAVALSAQDGRVLKRLRIPDALKFHGWWDDPMGLAWWNGTLVVSAWETSSMGRGGLFLLDPDTGQLKQKIVDGDEPQGVTVVDGKVWWLEGWCWCAIRLDPRQPDKRDCVYLAAKGGGTGSDLAATGDGVWSLARELPVLVKTDAADASAKAVPPPWKNEIGAKYQNPRLLDWAEKPFGHYTWGITWDGENLWALDGKSKRICLVEKANFGLPDSIPHSQLMAALPGVTTSLRFPGPVELAGDEKQVTFERTVTNPFRVPLEIRYTWDRTGSSWSLTPAEGVVKIAPGAASAIRTVGTLDRRSPAPLPVCRSTILIDGVEVTQVQHSPTPPILRRSATAVWVEEPPKTDGELAEGEYGAAKPNGQFGRYKGRGDAEHDTSFRLAYDDKALYICVIAQEPDPDGIVGKPRKRDGQIWRDDGLELFLDATFDRSTYHHLVVSLKHCVQYDSMGGPDCGQYGDRGWNGDWKAASKVGKDRVVVELAIPFDTLFIGPPNQGGKWGLNLCRHRNGRGGSPEEMSAWCFTYRSFHRPSHFGVVTFE